jgi:hypothetical protein
MAKKAKSGGIVGRCMKCKKQVEMVSPKASKTSRGTTINKGKCPVCGTTVCRMGDVK